MTTAFSATSEIGYVEETVYGTTPGSPAVQAFEVASFDGDPKPTILTDKSINSNRQLMSLPVRGNESIEGTIECVYGPTQYDEFLSSLMGADWAADVLKMGNAVKSFAIEDGITNIAQYRVFNGSVIYSLKLSIPVNDYATASFGFKSKAVSTFTGTPIDASYTAVPATTKFFHDGGTFKEGGATLAYFSGLELEITVASTDVFCLGDTAPYVVVPGKIDVKGKASFLFEDATLYNKFRNNTASSLEFTLVGGANTHKYELPKIAYTAAPLKRNEDGPVELDMSFTAAYDASSTSTLTITRT